MIFFLTGVLAFYYPGRRGDDDTELQRSVFEECLVQSRENDAEAARERQQQQQQTTTTTTPEHQLGLGDKQQQGGVVPIAVIIDNVHQNFARVPHFR